MCIRDRLTPEQISYTYASEADLLNVALFGKRAKQWRNENPEKKGNIRDEANLNQLLVLSLIHILSVVALGLIIWLIILLVKDPKGVVKEALFKKK